MQTFWIKFQVLKCAWKMSVVCLCFSTAFFLVLWCWPQVCCASFLGQNNISSSGEYWGSAQFSCQGGRFLLPWEPGCDYYCIFAAVSGVFSVDIALSVKPKEPFCSLAQHVGEGKREKDILQCLLLWHAGTIYILYKSILPAALVWDTCYRWF